MSCDWAGCDVLFAGLDHGNSQLEGCARLGFHKHQMTAMILNQLVADGQSQPGAALTHSGRKKSSKNLGFKLLLNARACIPDHDTGVFPFASTGNEKPPAPLWLHHMTSVVEQVNENLLDFLLIGQYFDGRISDPDFDGDVIQFKLGPDHLYGAGYDSRYRDGFPLEVLYLCKGL